ncbi:MAG: 4Fe-4S binding protein [Oscillospiraceae bacterium]|nr:4Fe-4S binding protein [Oscillospiraceae bacterium]
MRIIDFNSNRCRHCYKCVRNCEIKAISVRGGRAVIMEDHCILCGRCLAVCPQEAKTLTSELPQVKAMIRRGERVAAQLAPSYVGLLEFQQLGQVRAALRKLGFADVFETAEGAAAVTDAYLQLIEEERMDNIITTCCPAVNDMIEMYFPALVPALAPVVSPMIASGRIIKQRLGIDTRVVFIGPCIAKRKEARDLRHADAVDAVLSFDELKHWLVEEDIRIDECEDEPFPFDPAVNRLYPVTGGVLASVRAGLSEDASHHYRQFCVHGLSSCIELCRDIAAGSVHRCVIEMNSCENGCVKGPAISGKGVYPYKIKLEMQERIRPEPVPQETLRHSMEGVSLDKQFEDRSHDEPMPTEEEIRQILAKTGKHSPEDELNCGACGYASCREKAIAVYLGKAELEMCIPYLTSQAESMANLILNESPNAMIIADASGHILEYAAVGERFFHVSREQALKSRLSDLISPQDWETVQHTHHNIYGKKVYYKSLDLWTLQNVVYIPKLNSTLMTFIDITAQEKRLRQEQEARNATMEMAQNVIRNQMFTAQKIASLLGETTAETKMTLTRLMNVMQDKAYEQGGDSDAPEAQAADLPAVYGDDASSLAVEASSPSGGSGIPDPIGDLPMAPASGKPKLKINTKYARPAPGLFSGQETASNEDPREGTGEPL